MTTNGFWKWALVWAAVVGFVPASHANVRTLPVMRIEAPRDLPAYAPGRVIVKYRESASKAEAERESEHASVRASVGATVRRIFATMPDIETLSLAPEVTVESAVAALAADPRVAYAEPDYLVSVASLPNDTHFDQEWGLDNTGQVIAGYPGEAAGIDIDAAEAWEHGTGSADVVVADLDEGCDYRHPDLAANMWTNPGEVADNGVDDDGNGFVDDVHGWDFLHDDASTFDGAFDSSNQTDFHGTHTTGTIGAVGNNGTGVAGVCWTVRVMSLKFLERSGDTSDAIAAFDYAVMMKGRGVNLRAINCSWGGPEFSQSLHDAIGRAGDADILVCVSSGNGGSDGRADNDDTSPTYPASYDLANMITVGAWTRYDQAATFSNFGPTSVDLLAPGGLVASTGPNGSYYFSSGTSMAAPHVTGAVALVASVAPSLTAVQIKEVILGTVTPVAAPTQTATNGRLNLNQAVEAAISLGGDGDPGGPPPPPPPPPPIVYGAKFSPGKKTLIVDGLRFGAASVVEINGVPMPVVTLSEHDLQDDGSYIRISGKAPGEINALLPKRQAVVITVFDPGTGQRSAPLEFTRRR